MSRDDGFPAAGHVHRRDKYPCPALRHPPRRPLKPAARFWFDFADAIVNEDTFRAFVREHPADFQIVRRLVA